MYIYNMHSENYIKKQN